MRKKPIHNIDFIKLKRNAYPDLLEMRDVNSICFLPRVNTFMICNRDSIYEREKNINVFSSFQPKELITSLMGQNMLRKDGGAHAEKRKTIFKTISKKLSNDHWQDKFETTADTLIENIKERKHGD